MDQSLCKLTLVFPPAAEDALVELLLVLVILGILAAIWGIGSFLFILLGFLFALAFLMLTH